MAALSVARFFAASDILPTASATDSLEDSGASGSELPAWITRTRRATLPYSAISALRSARVGAITAAAVAIPDATRSA